MPSHFPIAALAWLFGVVTVAAIAAVAYRFRRRPVIALIAAGERRLAFHRDGLAALDATIAAARAEGRTGEAERLAPAQADHRRALADLAAIAEFSVARPKRRR